MTIVGTAAMAINIALAIFSARTAQQIVHGEVAQLLNGLRYQETLAIAFAITSMPVISCGISVVSLLRHIPKKISVSLQDTTITYGLAAASNVVLTALTVFEALTIHVAGRILWMRRDASHIPVDKILRLRCNMAIRLILESGVIYCIGAIVFLITSLGATEITSTAATSSIIGVGFMPLPPSIPFVEAWGNAAGWDEKELLVP
ncbi:hypothetical protein B0H19DRAFT_1085785 [Mycena capillaripes]|nr:hypothetical protein B0H19DRAFT_1085785 [Mycena capillaripes]